MSELVAIAPFAKRVLFAARAARWGKAKSEPLGAADFFLPSDDEDRFSNWERSLERLHARSKAVSAFLSKSQLKTGMFY
jgi:hypothetical protein